MSQPDLASYDLLIVNSSAGKDSQCTLDVVMERRNAEAPELPVHVVHADLGRMEWPGTKELAARQAEHYGLRFHVARRRRITGEEETLLEYVRRRGKWPSATTRYCTSDMKRGPCGVVIRRLANELTHPEGRPLRVLNCFGFRAEESPARAKRESMAINKPLTCGKRAVWDWLPIHDWKEQEVWDRIHASGVPYHRAYDAGMPRLSCCFCIFAPRNALITAGRENPELLDEYVEIEKEIGHDFQHKKPIADIKAAIDAGEVAGDMSGDWNM